MFEYKIRSFTIAIVVFLVFIAAYTLRYINLMTTNIDYNIAASATMNRNIMKKWNSKLEGFYNKQHENLKLCNPSSENNWFENKDYFHCNVIWSGESRICSFWTYNVLCFSFAIPHEYFRDGSFVTRLKKAIKQPCKIFDKTSTGSANDGDKYADLARKIFKCSALDNSKYFSFYITIYSQDIDTLNKQLFKISARNRSIEKIIYFDWSTDKFILLGQ